MATILYVEDNADNKLLVDRVAESLGHQLLWAENGQQGLDMAEAHQPSLILLDINLPDMDGYEVARRLRANPIYAKVPIVAVTANALKGDDVKVRAAGCDGYITKPVHIGELRKQMMAFLNTPV